MAATMRILGWTASNLRCPDHEVNCCDMQGEPYPVTLVQMPNGTGKTTTLNLLRAALSGVADKGQWSTEQVQEYRKRGGNDDQGRFELRLALNGKLVTIVMLLTFDEGTVHYKTTHGPGQSDGFNPPHDFRRFMSENFVEFYVFDGELAQKLLDRNHVNAESVVEHMFQINTLETMLKKVDEYWDDKTRTASAREVKGLTRNKNRLNELNQRLQELNRAKAALESRRKRLQEQLSQKQKAYEEEINKEKTISEQLAKASTKVTSLEEQVKTEAQRVLDQMTEPYALSPLFAEAIYGIKTGLDRVKLPESAAREFFQELAEENHCICGRPIDDEIRQTILTRSKQYLGSDDVSLLNTMKTAIEEAVGASRTQPEQELTQKIDELAQVVTQQREAKNELADLEIQAGKSDPEVQQAKEQIDRLKADIEKVDTELKKYGSLDDSQTIANTHGISVIEEQIKKVEHKVAEITRTLELKQKRDLLRQILRDAHQKAKISLTSEICVEANNRISMLMPHNNIRIEKIEKCLILQEQRGGSVGEQLSVAYGFLATLFDRSDHQLPFIVDSPAGPIDLAIRPEIGKLVPKLSKQFIAFTISSERAGFVPSLARSTQTPIQYVTVFRKGATDLDGRAKVLLTATETDDGFCVTDETFFNEFQVEAEDI